MQADRKEETEESNDDGLGIEVLESRAQQHVAPPLMEQIGLCHPFSLSIYGSSGSGKTVLAINILKDPRKYGGFFDEIHVFGLTARSDDTWKHIALKREFIHDDFDKLVPDLRALLQRQRRDVEANGILACKKVCIVFEDVTTNIKLLNSSAYHQAYVQNRHNGVTSIAMCHKFHAQNRTCRLNSGHSMIFPLDDSDFEQVVKETCSPGLSRRDYAEIVAECLTPDEDAKHPFMWLNNKVDPAIRIRKTLRHIIRVT